VKLFVTFVGHYCCVAENLAEPVTLLLSKIVIILVTGLNASNIEEWVCQQIALKRLLYLLL